MSENDQRRSKQEVLARLSALLDDIDAKTRRPDEGSLRSEVAREARERLAEMRDTR